jgi:hypothetical protein
MSKLDLDSLTVSSFATSDEPTTEMLIAQQRITPMCCTGCVSGCGINPTASGCDSGGGGSIMM